MSGAPPPQPGELSTTDDPLDIETDVLELLNNSAGVATVENLVGVAADSTSTDGTLVYPTAGGAQGVPTDLAVRIDGVERPVTAIEYADAAGTLRPVTKWHLGPLREFALTLNSLTFVQPATFDVSVSSTNSPANPGGTLDVTATVNNTGGAQGTQDITLDIDNGVGEVDRQSVTLSGAGSATQTLSWSVSSGQTKQDYTATVSSENDSESTSVTVESAGPNIPLSFENWNGFGQSGLSYVENDANEGGRTYVELPSGRNSFYATASQLGFSNGIKKMQFEVKHPGYTDTLGNGSVIGGISSINRPIDTSDDTISIRDEINTEFANLSEAVLIIGSNEGKTKIIPDDQLANQWFTISIDVVNGTASANGVTISYEPANSPHDSVVFNQAADFSSFKHNGNFKVSENYTIIEK